MAIKVILFGQLGDIAGRQAMEIEYAADTRELVQKVHDSFPELADITYRIAVEKKIITDNTALQDETTVALLPPFSGG
jgi:molybdopterin converting factor small subunit